MKPLYFFLLLIIFSACGETKVGEDESSLPPETKIVKKESDVNLAIIPPNSTFQKLLDEAKLKGVILVYDPHKKEYISNDFERSQQGFLPASTFKVPNSMILLETGVIEDENTILKWDGKKRAFKMWEQDFEFKNAFKKSCLPCYQEVTPKVGVDRMKEHLQKFNYGNMVVDSASMNSFWINGDSKISAKQQIDFLSKLYYSKLPISLRTEDIMKKIMVIDESENYKLSGKTGWLMEDDYNLGWFVGFIEKGKNVYFVATNVEPLESFNMKNFPNIRMKISLDALKHLKIL